MSNQATFTVGDVLCLTTGLPLYGEQSFNRLKKLGEFVSGLPLTLAEEPAEDDAKNYLTLVTWSAAVLETTNRKLLALMADQHAPMFRLSRAQIALVTEDMEGQLRAAADLCVVLDGLDIDLNAKIEISALKSSDQRKLAKQFADEDYRERCLVNMLMPIVVHA